VSFKLVPATFDSIVMAERLDEIDDDDFWGVRSKEKTFDDKFLSLFPYLSISIVSAATENLDPHLLQDVSTLHISDQIEVNNAVADNEGGDPAESVPKAMTPISCLNEICVVRKLSIPQYESMGEVGVAHMKIFTMEVWVRDMDLRGMLNPSISHIYCTV